VGEALLYKKDIIKRVGGTPRFKKEEKMMRYISIWAIVLGIICMGLSVNGIAQPIRVGAVINLTGPASTWGQYHAKGHRDYINYVNEVKGGVAGRKIELTIVDHAYKAPEAVKFVKKFCEDKMDMIATWDAGSGNQAKPIIQEYKIPTINYSVDQALIKSPADYMYLPFGSYILDSYMVLDYIRNIHKGKEAPKVGLLTYNSPYGKTIHEPSNEYAAKNNINIVSIEEFPSTTVDLTTEMLRLKNKGAEYIFMQILPAGVITALKAADKIGYNVPIFGTWTTTDPDFFTLGKGLIRDRLAMQFCGVLPQDKTPGIEILQKLWAKYKTVNYFETSYWEGVVVAMIEERAAHRAAGLYKTINAENINKAMETFKNEDFGGLVPYVTFTKDNHEGSFRGRIVKINEDATYEPMTDFYVPGKEKIKVLKAPKL
jgi:branched-chain amino acid transport system substrate-binding protein